MSLINQAKCRAYTLERARATHRPFTRVSKAFLEALEARLKESIQIRVHSAPSKGKTL